MPDRATERNICLTEAEAMGLLDIMMLCPADLTAEQRAAMLKLSDFCRQFLREGGEAAPALSRSGTAALPARLAA